MGGISWRSSSKLLLPLTLFTIFFSFTAGSLLRLSCLFLLVIHQRGRRERGDIGHSWLPAILWIRKNIGTAFNQRLRLHSDLNSVCEFWSRWSKNPNLERFENQVGPGSGHENPVVTDPQHCLTDKYRFLGRYTEIRIQIRIKGIIRIGIK
jgi:hypothetical protein